jgi:ubiquinone/menaquinone biosynthesis C-methylase UbiE
MSAKEKHWDKVFSRTKNSNLGWYEDDTSQTFKMLDFISDWEDLKIFISGAGTSVLIDELLLNGSNLILNDISAEALNQVKSRLMQNDSVEWLCQDISKPINVVDSNVDLWIDRAVLHFLTEEKDIKGYFDNVKSVVKNNGHVLLAEFSKNGAEKCAGLDVRRYSVDELSEELGVGFELISHYNFTYINPSGDERPYIYTLFKRVL